MLVTNDEQLEQLVVRQLDLGLIRPELRGSRCRDRERVAACAGDADLEALRTVVDIDKARVGLSLARQRAHPRGLRQDRARELDRRRKRWPRDLSFDVAPPPIE